MECYPAKIIEWARGEVGYKEKASNRNLESKTENAGAANFNKYAWYIDTKYPDFYNGKKNGFDWCDIFVDCGFILCYGYEEAMRLLCQPEKSLGAGCQFSMRYFEAKGQMYCDPQPGDQAFFTDATKGICHTGIVVSTNYSLGRGGQVSIVEGNASNQVSLKTYYIGTGKIYGYGRPKYSVWKAPEGLSDEELDRVALDVIFGKYGNGSARKINLETAGYDYNIVQARVNALLAKGGNTGG